MSKQTKVIATITITLSVVSVAMVFLWASPNIESITEFSQQHRFLAPFILIIWRILAIIVPPLPGGIFSIVLLPVFGWFWSFVYAMIGILTGASIAFWLGRVFREPLVRKFVPLQQIHKWEETLSSKKEFLAFLGIRLTTGPVMDFISYVAGLSKIRFTKFFIATFLATLPEALLYYVGEEAYKRSVYLAIVVVVIFLIVFYVLKKIKFFQKKWG